tara:strand:- start:4304 stop:4465 length:162 start_codon:yes stop_codon:yes gene_type:complete
MPTKIVKTPLPKMIAEHVKLLKVLKTGTPKQIKEEVADQSKELKKYLKMKRAK